MNDVIKCPRCGADQPVGSTGGVCPRCAAGLLQATQTEIPGEGTGTFTPPTVEELAAKFPQLEIIALIGRGGMGAVYKARQKELDRLVALKILPPDIGRDAAFAERFTREARALAKLNHPGIVTIYDFGRADGLYFFLMELVDGMNMRELLHRQRISAREALAIVPQICDALQFAHDQGIVHRDIKPENLLIDRRGRVKVADFGLAKLIGTEPDPASPPDSPAGSPALTEAGKIMGTPNYMSPEQVEHPGEVDHRADIYALGVVFYQMLTGELPEKQLQPPSRKVQIDVRLDEVVLRALEQQPERRYQQASTMKLQVETIAQGAAGAVPAFATRVNQGVDYKTKATLFGLPWVHVATGQDPLTGRVRIARGIFAVGGVAQGVVACGGVAMGGISLGGLALGVFSYGGLAVGLLAFGGLGVGLLGACGGLAVAPVALGGEAVGWLAAGAKGIGTHVLDVAGSDPVARTFFNPWSGSFLKNAYMANYFLVVLLVLLTSGLPMWLAWRSRGRTPGGNRVPNQPLPPGTVEAWLALMDQGDYAGNWAAASVYFQRAMRREEWVRRGESIRGPLGRVLSRELISTRYKYLGTRVEVKYNTVFEGLTAAAETVSCMREPNGEWKSVGYLIKPAPNPMGAPDGFPAETATPISARQLREAYTHMTASEKQATWAFSVFYAIWNSATFFLPMACLMFFPLPVPLNWIIATAALLTGLAFYPLWWKHQARVVCSSAWAQAQGWRPESVRAFPWGSTGLMLAGVLWLALVGLIWWQDYRPEGVWQPWLAEASLQEPSAGGTACVREVRQYGQCLWLRMSCDPLPGSAVLTPALTGPLIELPYHLPAAATNVDCLITTAPHSTGKVIAGYYDLSGKTNFTVGFMLPDGTAAAAAVKLIRRMELNQPHGVDGALFALRRTLGKDGSGAVMEEDIFGSLQLQGRPATIKAHTLVYTSRSGEVAAKNPKRFPPQCQPDAS